MRRMGPMIYTHCPGGGSAGEGDGRESRDGSLSTDNNAKYENASDDTSLGDAGGRREGRK
jgi:hypothetical protein